MIKLKQSTKRYNQYQNPIAQELDPLEYGFKVYFPRDYEEFINEYGECKVEDCIHILPHSKVYKETKKLRENEKYIQFMVSFNLDIDPQDFLNNLLLVGIGCDSDLIIFYKNNYHVFFYAVDEKWMTFKTLDEVFESYSRGDYWGAIELNSFTTVCD